MTMTRPSIVSAEKRVVDSLCALGIVKRHDEALEGGQLFVRLLRGMGMKVFYAKTISYTPIVSREGSWPLVHDPIVLSNEPAFLAILPLRESRIPYFVDLRVSS